MNSAIRLGSVVWIFFFVAPLKSRVLAEDWPMLGRDRSRNPVSSEQNPPTDWDIGRFDRRTGQWNADRARNIKWYANLGSQSFGVPVVAGGNVYIGTNNGAGYLDRYPKEIDLGCLLCFRETTGEFLWQYSAEKLRNGRTHDWPMQGIGSAPLVEGDRMWFVSNRCEVVCLDTSGFRDGENDGRYQDEPVASENEADIVWSYDLIGELGCFPHNLGMGPHRRCSPAASYKNLIYVVTGNGVDSGHRKVPAPDAPSLVGFDKSSGRVLWIDSSPGPNILHLQMANPLVVEIGGRGQVIVPQGDGWIRSFDAIDGTIMWEFDINPKTSKWILGGEGSRNNILATPIFYKGRVYVASGQEIEHGEGEGRLVCIDPSRTGDISSELAVDSTGKLLPKRRVQAVDPTKGEKSVVNPNSGLIWEYTLRDDNGDGMIDFEEEFHRTVGSIAIKDDLLVATDFSGLVHCLNAQTGRRYWYFDMLAQVLATPLIVDKFVYVADEDGDVAVFRLEGSNHQAVAERLPIREVQMGGSVYSQPVFANGVLYIATKRRLFAITNPDRSSTVDDQSSVSTADVVPVASRDVRVRTPKPVFLPTPLDVVEEMLGQVSIAPGDTLVDMGSGDGRIVIAAAKHFGAHAIGYEIDAELVYHSRRLIQQTGMSRSAEIRERDMYEADLSNARFVTTYLYPSVLQRLKPQFDKMKAGSWVISHRYEIPDLTPTRVAKLSSAETGNVHHVYMYETPLSERSR